MLALTREPGECIVMGDDEEIVVQVGEIRKGKVKLRIKAPDEVSIDRLEVRAAKKGNHVFQCVPTQEKE